MIWRCVCQVQVLRMVVDLGRGRTTGLQAIQNTEQALCIGKLPVPLRSGAGSFEALRSVARLFPDLQSDIKGAATSIDQEENSIPSCVGTHLFIELRKAFHGLLVHLKNDISRSYAGFSCG